MAAYEGPRSIEENELSDLIDMLNLVFRPDGGDMGREYPRHVAACNRENVRIIKEEGKIVSHVATSVRPLCLGGVSTWEAGIGAVATLPEGRGKGYASILMDDAVRRSVAQGADLMLISGDLGVYRRMHAVDCGRYPVLRITADVPQDNPDFSVKETALSDIDAILDLWESLPTRYILPREDWEALFECKHVMDKPSHWWTVRFGDDIAGFGIVYKKEKELMLLDWAGHSDALEAAAAFWFQQYGVNSITYVPSSMSYIPTSWRSKVEKYQAFDGTVLVIEARRFLQRSESYLTERIGEKLYSQVNIDAEAQRASFELNGERAVFENGGELAMLFFGSIHEDIVDRKCSPGSDLNRLLHRAFPMPLVWYGVGYV